jgi:hypothetical protein
MKGRLPPGPLHPFFENLQESVEPRRVGRSRRVETRPAPSVRDTDDQLADVVTLQPAVSGGGVPHGEGLLDEDPEELRIDDAVHLPEDVRVGKAVVGRGPGSRKTFEVPLEEVTQRNTLAPTD